MAAIQDDDSWLYGSSNKDKENHQNSILNEGKSNSEKEVSSEPHVEVNNSEVNTLENKDEASMNGTCDDKVHSDEVAITEVENKKVSVEDDDDVITIEDHTPPSEDTNGDAKKNQVESDDDSDDDVQVTIGAITTTANEGTANRNSFYKSPVQAALTPKTSSSKVIDLTVPGSVNGQPVIDISLESLEDKPWRKPGADISDYFNYGFNEVTWSLYCDKQRRLRSGLDAPTIPISTMSSAERASSVVSSILAKYDIRNKLATNPPSTRQDVAVRSISTLQFTRRSDLGSGLISSSSSSATSIGATPAQTTTPVYTVPVNGPTLPIQFDITKPPPTLPLGIPPMNFPAGPALLPPLRPPGTEFIQLPPVTGAAFIPHPTTFLHPPGTQPPLSYSQEDSEENHGQLENTRSDEEKYREYRSSRRDYDRERDRDYDRERDRYSRRMDYRDGRDDYRDRSRDRDRTRDRDRDRDRDSRRRREESPRHKSSRRKYNEEDRYSSKHKKAKKHKHKDKDEANNDNESLLAGDQIKKEPVDSS